MGNTTIMGKPSNTIGAPNSQLILRGSSIKILWGNKFIDLVKNGKLASDKSDILKTISSSDDINSNGIYLIPETNEVWVSIDGAKVNLAGEVGTAYVSFLTEQKEVTADLKYMALTNAGLYYETLEEAQQAGIKAGIIFIVGENKLYLANNGLLSEYNIFSTSSSETEGTSLDELTIKDLKIYNDGMNMIISSPSLQFNINKKLALDLNFQIKSYLDIVMQSGTYIQSSNATSTTGYRLYIKDGKSILEVDSVILNNIDILDRTSKIIDNTIHTRIGIVKESDFESLKTCPEKLEEVLVGMYSDNFIGLNSKLYDTIFKKRCDYPKYDETITIPEDFQNEKYNQIIPNIGWIRELLKLAVPKGTIAMFNGSSKIPEGWAVCDGNNGTPNLIGKFIKAVASTDLVGDNDTVLNENNELTITLENLPKHSHPHKEHTHSLSGTLSGTTGTSGNLSTSFELDDYNWGITSDQKTFVTSVTGEGVTTETGTVNSVSNIKTLGGKATGGDHSHSISLNIAEGTSISSTTSEELILEDTIWTNKPIKIEPHSYSLIFIMKL